MIPLDTLEQLEADPGVMVICEDPTCGWSGTAAECKHLGGVPVCPPSLHASLSIVEEGDDVDIDL